MLITSTDGKLAVLIVDKETFNSILERLPDPETGEPLDEEIKEALKTEKSIPIIAKTEKTESFFKEQKLNSEFVTVISK